MQAKMISELVATGKPYRIYAEVLEDEALRQFVGSMSRRSRTRTSMK